MTYNLGEGEVIKVEEECAGVCEGVREISESYNYFPKVVISLSPGHCGETMLSFKNCGEIYITFIILSIFKCTILWH